jgi:hypothetical protein
MHPTPLDCEAKTDNGETGENADENSQNEKKALFAENDSQ